MSLRILLADENLAVQKLIEQTLGKEGMEVTVTDNGLSALDLALKRTPDLILLDLNLEGLDIFTFIKRIKNHERLSDIPVILLINATQHHDSDQFQSGEIAAFFKKPIDAQELLEEVKKQTESTENMLADLASPRKKDPSDIAQYFSDSESDAKQVESLLGWSSSESSCNTVSETLEEETIAPPLRIGDSDEDDSESQTIQSFPFDVPDEAQTAQEDSSPFPFSSTESPPNDLFEVSATEEEDAAVEKESIPAAFISGTNGPAFLPHPTTSLDLEKEQVIVSSPDSDDITQNLDENIGKADANPPQAELEDGPASEESSREKGVESVPSSLTPVLEEVSSSPEQASSDPPMDQALPLDRLLIDEAIKKNVQESVEKVVWEILPELLRTALSKEVMAPIVEKVVWEVIVPLAESEIKKEISRLQAKVS